MSLWEFAAAVSGWNKAHGAEEGPQALTSSDFDEMMNRHATWIATVH